MFEKATRRKLRIASAKGNLSIEDVWDLPLRGGRVNLDTVAQTLARTLREAAETSFVSPAPSANTSDQLALDIVKHIIAVKLADEARATKAADTRAFNQRVSAVLAEKRDDELKGKTIEELQALIGVE